MGVFGREGYGPNAIRDAMNDATSPEPWSDPDDAPPLTAEWFAGADVYDGATLVRRGRPMKISKYSL